MPHRISSSCRSAAIGSLVLHLCPVVLCAGLLVHAQTPEQTPSETSPRVIIPTQSTAAAAAHRSGISTRPSAGKITYPWKMNITTTVFWIGEQPTENNPVPNDVSAWDKQWVSHFGGYDDPAPESRIASHGMGDFRPRSFVPKLNPFYIALPYNDKESQGYRSEAARVIPWFNRVPRDNQQTSLKGRWLQIFANRRSCYAQWEDVGPFETDDWPYVFGDKPPKNPHNNAAGLDISPAVRDYLGISSGQKVHWRFVEPQDVPYGPWKRYGSSSSVPGVTELSPEQMRRFELLRQQRDALYRQKTRFDLQNGQ